MFPLTPSLSSTSTPASSPPSPITHLLDDIFSTSRSPSPSSSPSPAPSSSQSRQSADIVRLRSTHTTAGYRDGLAATKEAALQPGFDEGYVLGGALGLEVGYLRGIVEGMSGVFGSGREGAGMKERLRMLHASMENELRVENLLSAEYLHPDGTWKWDVPEEDAGTTTTTTTAVVALSHPLIVRWKSQVRTLMREVGISRDDIVESWDAPKSGEGGRDDKIGREAGIMESSGIERAMAEIGGPTKGKNQGQVYPF